MVEKQHDLRLVGDMETLGGQFGRVRITGDSILTSDVYCDEFYMTGTTHIKGSLASGHVKFTGEVYVDGSVRSGSVRGTGELELARDFRGDQVRITGQLSSSHGMIEAEKLDLRGAIQTGGTINAGQALIRLYGPSSASEFVGGTVTIRRSKGALLKELFQHGSSAEFRAGLIEGDRIDLEHTIAEVVRGKAIRIGPGCQIGRVEYRDSYEKNDHAKVDSVYRI